MLMPLSRSEILKTLSEEEVKFLRLQFTDILGANKNVEVPASQFEKALDGEILFDGSSIEGFTRIEESDMVLKPDYDSFVVFPPLLEDSTRGKVARFICDVYHPDDRPFEGDPRYALRRQIEKLNAMGFDAYIGPEAEFFLFLRTPEGNPTTLTHDAAGYFDLAPLDRGEVARRDMVNTLVALGFEIEADHHEVAPGQHEIDFKYESALKTADNLVTFRHVVKRVALAHGLHATFMPKPITGINGSGMHSHVSLFKDGQNAFYNPDSDYQLSQIAMNFIAGLLIHAEEIVGLTNPTVNSYKRLAPGYEAPTNVAWSASNRSAMIRIPARRGVGTRAELRMPDPSANPYLATMAILAAGIDGIEKNLVPPPPIQRNIFRLTTRERRRYRIRELPGTLAEAVNHLASSELMHQALGEHLFEHYLEAKRLEWDSYRTSVHQWELDRYLTMY